MLLQVIKKWLLLNVGDNVILKIHIVHYLNVQFVSLCVHVMIIIQ